MDDVFNSASNFRTIFLCMGGGKLCGMGIWDNTSPSCWNNHIANVPLDVWYVAGFMGSVTGY